MGKLERITITMPEEMAAKMRAAVDSGEYATTSEVVREAIRDWSDLKDRNNAELTQLRVAIAEAEAGPSYPAEQVFAELREIAAKAVSLASIKG